MSRIASAAVRFVSGLAHAFAVALAVGAPAPAAAHDIPASTVVQAFARPADGALEIVVRVPLKALRDVDIPLRGRGFLDLERAAPALREAAERWLPEAFEVRDGDRDAGRPAILALRASLESERPYARFDTARALVLGAPLPASLEVPAEQVMVDALLRWTIVRTADAITVRPRVERLGLRVTTSMHAELPDGSVRAWALHGDPGPIALDPGAGGVFAGFVRSGAGHVLGGLDHLLFVACLVIPVRRLRPLVGVVTAFTVAHSITLAAAAFGLSPGGPWFVPAVETAIAASIVWMAIENVLGLGARRHRWAIAFVFGLIHGFGFAFGLAETLQFAGDHLLIALLAFNVGVELGQLAALAVLVPVLALLLERWLPGRPVAVVLSVLIGHTAWHWMTERGAPLAALWGG